MKTSSCLPHILRVHSRGPLTEIQEALKTEPDPGGGPPGKTYVPSTVNSKVLGWLHFSQFAYHPGIFQMMSLACFTR